MLLLLLTLLFAAPNPDGAINMLPLNCSELMPEMAPYLGFLESTGNHMASNISDRRFAKKIFKILYLRNKVQVQSGKDKIENPVDPIIQKGLCFYRVKTEPIKTVSADDPQFLDYLRKNIGDLERKVDQAIFELERERIQREAYEKRMQKNWNSIERLKQEAVIEGNQSLSRISGKASRSVKLPQ